MKIKVFIILFSFMPHLSPLLNQLLIIAYAPLGHVPAPFQMFIPQGMLLFCEFCPILVLKYTLILRIKQGYEKHRLT